MLAWEDYEKLTYPEELMKDEATNPNFKAMSIMIRRSRQRWSYADVNEDTVLTKDEFRNFIHPEESDKHKDILVTEAMQDMDPNKDGAVTLDEYMNHLIEMTDEQDRNEEGWAQVRLLALF